MAAAFAFVFSYLLLFCVFVAILEVSSERTSQKIYKSLDADFACFRRLNGTHQIGCSSDRDGNVGVVHYVADSADMSWLIEQGPHEPYTVIIEPIFFNRGNLSMMQASGKINGVLLLLNSTEPSLDQFSPDQTCPNRGHGLYDRVSTVDGCSVEWNPPGDAMFFGDWKFPIFMVRKQDDIDSLLQFCFRKHNAPVEGLARTWPLCAAELFANMYAAVDSKTCIRRTNMITNLNRVKVCDPLGDYNVWSTLWPMNRSEPLRNRSLVFVTARLDAFSMFENYVPGGDAAVSGVVVLLAAAEALRNRMRSKVVAGRNVVFVVFNGEAFDYLGSTRMVYDMRRGSSPVASLHHVGHFLELSQVALLASSSAVLWAHSDPLSTAASSAVNATVDAMLSALAEASSGGLVNVRPAPWTNPLPPASLHSFLKADLAIPGLVLTDHQLAYSNRYYNSMFDFLEASNSSVASLHAVAQIVASTVYRLLTSEAANVSVSRDRVEQLLQCYASAGNCSLVDATTPASQRDVTANLGTPNHYVGVDNVRSEVRFVTTNLMAYLLGDLMPNVSAKQCKNSEDSMYSYKWMTPEGHADGVCVRSTVNITKATSPAFDIDDYDYASAEFPTWTESSWDTYSLRIFLKPSPWQEVATLGVGVLVLLASFAIVWFLNRNSDVLFPASSATSATTTSAVAVAC